MAQRYSLDTADTIFWLTQQMLFAAGGFWESSALPDKGKGMAITAFYLILSFLS